METYSTLPGYVKVKLTFKTWEPVHLRSHVLKTEYKISPPYLEEVSVWMNPKEVYPRLSAYQDIFNRLAAGGIISAGAQLHSFTIIEGDTTTLAYIEKDL